MFLNFSNGTQGKFEEKPKHNQEKTAQSALQSRHQYKNILGLVRVPWQSQILIVFLSFSSHFLLVFGPFRPLYLICPILWRQPDYIRLLGRISAHLINFQDSGVLRKVLNQIGPQEVETLAKNGSQRISGFLKTVVFQGKPQEKHCFS